MREKDTRQRENVIPNFQFIVARAWESWEEVGRDEPREGGSQIIRAMCTLYTEAINKVFNIYERSPWPVDEDGLGGPR